jgi:hypothetical protein
MQDEEKKYEGNALLKEGQYGKFRGFGIRREAIEEWLRNNPDQDWMNGHLYPNKEGDKAKVRVFSLP